MILLWFPVHFSTLVSSEHDEKRTSAHRVCLSFSDDTQHFKHVCVQGTCTLDLCQVWWYPHLWGNEMLREFLCNYHSSSPSQTIPATQNRTSNLVKLKGLNVWRNEDEGYWRKQENKQRFHLNPHRVCVDYGSQLQSISRTPMSICSEKTINQNSFIFDCS